MAILAGMGTALQQTGAASALTRDVVPVDSSFIQDIQWDSSVLTLTITMRRGDVYTYIGVAPSLVEEFFQASSKGEFYDQNLKGKYPGQRLISMSSGKRPKKNH